MTENQETVLYILRNALSPTKKEAIESYLTSEDNWNSIFTELNQQAVSGLVTDCLDTLSIPEQLQKQLLCSTMTQVAFYTRLLYEQDQLIQLFSGHSIPLSILKGCAVAIYYSNPSYRTMGDVDFLVPEERFEQAYQLMLDNGYILAADEDNVVYHYTLAKNGITFEIHRWPAGMTEGDTYLYNLFQDGGKNAEKVLLDDFLIPVLPSLQNGLVLMLHIVKHLRSGLGLRQIIDWMMYVDKQLGNEKWEEYSSVYEKAGLSSLVVTVTKMCQIYLGLREDITWCQDADEKLCEELMEYVLMKGNFGHKENIDEVRVVNALARTSGIVGRLKDLQKNGCRNWETLKKYPILKPLAWAHELWRYAAYMVKNSEERKQLRENIRVSEKRKRMFAKLGQ